MLKSGQLLLGESNLDREGMEGGRVSYHGEIRLEMLKAALNLQEKYII